MDEAAAMGLGEAVRDVAADAQRFAGRHPPLPLQILFQRLAFQILHRLIGNAAIFADLIDGHDVVVLEPGGGASLADEAFPSPRIPRVARQNRLERDHPAQLRIFRFEDDAHAAAAEFFQHAIRPQPADFSRRPRRREQGGDFLGGRIRFRRCPRQSVFDARDRRIAADFFLRRHRRRIGTARDDDRLRHQHHRETARTFDLLTGTSRLDLQRRLTFCTVKRHHRSASKPVRLNPALITFRHRAMFLKRRSGFPA